jgi:hypothetical protein
MTPGATNTDAIAALAFRKSRRELPAGTASGWLLWLLFTKRHLLQ